MDSPDLSTSAIMSVPVRQAAELADSRDAGVRRGMLHAMMRMMVTQEVGSDPFIDPEVTRGKCSFFAPCSPPSPTSAIIKSVSAGAQQHDRNPGRSAPQSA